MIRRRSCTSMFRSLVLAAIVGCLSGPALSAESFYSGILPTRPPLPIAMPATNAPAVTSATVWTVNSADDTNDGVCDATNCTLREAMTVAQPGDSIAFSSLFASAQTINLGSALPAVGADLTITGPGARLLTVRANAAGFTILLINAGTVAISGLTIADGNADFGGAITNYGNLTLADSVLRDNHANYNGGALQNGGNMQVTGSTLSGNSAGFGAAVYNFVEGSLPGTAVLTNTTISGNSATNTGSSVENDWFSGATHAPTTTLVNCTLAGNTGGGSSLFAYSTGLASTINLQNTIVAGNSAPSIGTFGANAHVVSLGNNLASDSGNGFLTGSGDLINTDALLSELGNFGGPTPTHLLARNSPAVDGGSNSGAPATDQRGVPRPQGVAVDIGAVELHPLVVTTAADSTDPSCGGPCSLRDAITAANADGASADDIFFSSLFNTPQTITLTAALPQVAGDLTLQGPGANLLTLHGDRAETETGYALLVVNSGVVASVSGLTMTNGTNGGVRNAGVLTIDRCTVADNQGGAGGGIYNEGSLLVTNSAITGNTATDAGGVAVENGATGGSASIVNTTISGNTATGFLFMGFYTDGWGGGIYVIGGNGKRAAIDILNSTIADNSAVSVPGIALSGDQGGPAVVSLKNSIVANATPNLRTFGANDQILSLGHNLASDDGGGFLVGTGDLTNANPLLATLGNYGGTTQTQFLKPGSPALNAGDDSGAPNTDQRGVARPQGAHVDIGAVESDGILIFQDGFDGQ